MRPVKVEFGIELLKKRRKRKFRNVFMLKVIPIGNNNLTVYVNGSKRVLKPLTEYIFEECDEVVVERQKRKKGEFMYVYERWKGGG